MSTILEALKKSEEERNTGKIPTLSDMQAPHEPQRWPQMLLLVVIVLLMILIGLTIKFLMFPSKTQVLEPQPASSIQESVQQAEGNEQADTQVVDPNQKIIVSVVSYSDEPQKRFTMIDGKLVRENEFVRAGLKVEEIRQNEVVLNLRGEQIIRRP